VATEEEGPTERQRKDVLRLGARLADAEGFRVVALDGRDVGELDHPDEIVIKQRFLLWERRGVVKFDDVSAVDSDRERVYLAVPRSAIARER
jgi:hypothetical protein